MDDEVLDNNELDNTQGKTFVDPAEVAEENMADVVEVEPATPEGVIDDIVADYTMMVAPGEEGDGLFSLDQDYDKNGVVGDKRDISMLIGIKDILSYLEADISSKDFVRAVDEKIIQTDDLTVLKLLQHFLIHPEMQVFFKKSGRIGNLIDKLAKKIAVLDEENKKAEEAKNKADNEKKNQETIDTQDTMVTMLLGLTSMPMTKEGLIKYGEHLDEMKVFVADKSQFEKVMYGFIDAVKDSKDDKDTKNKKTQLYQSLIARFDGLKALVGQIETVIYGQGADALVASVGKRSVEELVNDAQFIHDLNGVIHMQKEEFEKLPAMLADQTKKESVMTIIKAYLVASGTLSKEAIQSIADINCVDGTGSHASKGKIFEPYDAEGKLIDDASVWFGVTKETIDKVTGNNILSYPPATIAEMFEPNENGIPKKFKDAFADMLNPSTSDGKDAESKTRRSFSEALSAMWNSGVWRELQKIFLSLDGMDGKMSEASTVQLDHLHALDAIESEWKNNKSSYKDYLPGKDISKVDIIAAVNAYKFASYSVTDEKGNAYQTTDKFGGEKHFFDTLLPEEQIAYILSASQRRVIQDGKNLIAAKGVPGVSLANFSTQYASVQTSEKIASPNPVESADDAKTGIALNNGKATIPELKRQKNGYTGNVELKVDDPIKPYLLIDGYGVGLSIDATNTKAIGSYAILEEGGEVFTKRIIVNLATASESARIEVSDVALNSDQQKAFDALYQNGTRNVSGLVDKKDIIAFRENFIARALAFADPLQTTPAMQTIMSGLQRDLFEMGDDEITLTSLKNMFEKTKTALITSIDNLSENTKPSKEQAGKAIDTWYTTLKLD